MSLATYHDLLLPGVRGRMDADLVQVDGGLWASRGGSRVLVVAKDEADKPWKDLRPVVVSRLEDAEKQLGRSNG